MMTQIEVDAARAQVREANALDKIAEELAVLTKAILVQNETLLELLKKK